MLDLVRAKVLPQVMEMGFASDVNAKKFNKTAELRAAFPFGWFNRVGERGQERVEIQFDKRGRDRFVLNFGVIPPEGVARPWGHFPPEMVDSVAGLDESYRLFMNAKSANWFGVGLIAINRERAVEKVLRAVIEALPEIDAYFKDGRIGQHVARIGFPMPPLLGASKMKSMED